MLLLALRTPAEGPFLGTESGGPVTLASTKALHFPPYQEYTACCFVLCFFFVLSPCLPLGTSSHPSQENNLAILSPISFFILFYLFLAVLGLHCWAQAFPSCREWGYSLDVVCGFLIAVVSLVSDHGL